MGNRSWRGSDPAAEASPDPAAGGKGPAADAPGSLPTYGRILVALDGSKRAEAILPHATAIAAQFGSTVVLLRATQPRGGGLASPLEAERLAEQDKQATAKYLERVAHRLTQQGLQVVVEQGEGKAAEVVVRHVLRKGVDLLALTTHGRGGLRRLLFGSVAADVLRGASCPVLLLRSRRAHRASEPATYRRILLTGDGPSALAQAAPPCRGPGGALRRVRPRGTRDCCHVGRQSRRRTGRAPKGEAGRAAAAGRHRRRVAGTAIERRRRAGDA